MHISLSKLALIVITSLITYSSEAGDYQLTQEDLDNIKKSKVLMDQARLQLEQQNTTSVPEWAESYSTDAGPLNHAGKDLVNMVNRSDEIKKKAVGINRDTKQNISNPQISTGRLTHDEELIIFATFNMPEQILRNILLAASFEGRNVSIVFKGMRKEDTAINHTALAIRQMIKDMDLAVEPNVKIDPRLFYQYGVNHAPTMVYRSKGKTVVAEGLETFETFLLQSREMISGGSLGLISKTYLVTEQDIVEVIKARLANIDWDQKKKDATKRYIARNTNFNLPESVTEKDVFYIIDPRVRFTRDVKAKDGTHFASAGEIVDPTQLMDQELTMYVLDATRPKQIQLIRQQLSENKGKGLKHILISKMEQSSDFSPIKDLQQYFGQPIFLLQPEMLEKFKLERTPAKIKVKKGIIQVTEYGTRTLSGITEGNTQNATSK